jgi:hypothetical protein
MRPNLNARGVDNHFFMEYIPTMTTPEAIKGTPDRATAATNQVIHPDESLINTCLGYVIASGAFGLVPSLRQLEGMGPQRRGLTDPQEPVATHDSIRKHPGPLLLR